MSYTHGEITHTASYHDISHLVYNDSIQSRWGSAEPLLEDLHNQLHSASVLSVAEVHANVSESEDGVGRYQLRLPKRVKVRVCKAKNKRINLKNLFLKFNTYSTNV